MMNEKKKYYLFYQITKSALYGVEPYEIYAFTDDIDMANAFVETRNMDLFYMKISKMDGREFSSMLKDGNLQRELIMYDGMTKDKNYKIKKFSIPLTLNERNMCDTHSSYMTHEKIFQFAWTPSTVYKKKYSHDLDILLYEALHHLPSQGYDDLVEYAVRHLVPDNLAVLIFLYHDVFLKNSLMKDEDEEL